jgi:hypothetical protein
VGVEKGKRRQTKTVVLNCNQFAVLHHNLLAAVPFDTPACVADKGSVDYPAVHARGGT